ncbi:ankyrin repeat [Fusarium denticulatum]|uniref:Ankyrin repeat n=1 Tax=Fusarium denticulatum TaxID=48507 RepID=A0A8H5T1J4_9HYPO|nr:ankyrin repeat [Fusarium denticulatum]
MSGFQLPSTNVSDLDEYAPFNVDHGAYIQKVEGCLELYSDLEKQASYHKVAHMVREKCQDLLEETGTKGVVTCRAKTYESLKAKLRSMENHTEFTSWALNNDIFQHHEMGDLAAVRIGLYLPQDVIKMTRECQQRFKIAHLFAMQGGPGAQKISTALMSTGNILATDPGRW